MGLEKGRSSSTQRKRMIALKSSAIHSQKDTHTECASSSGGLDVLIIALHNQGGKRSPDLLKLGVLRQ